MVLDPYLCIGKKEQVASSEDPICYLYCEQGGQFPCLTCSRYPVPKIIASAMSRMQESILNVIWISQILKFYIFCILPIEKRKKKALHLGLYELLIQSRVIR